MRPQKALKIDLNGEYPCPCRRKGHLIPITLTDAFGCNRCQQIFVVNENGHTIEQLSTHYPYKLAWRWTGKHWNRAYSNWRAHYLPIALVMILVPLVIWLPLALNSPGSNIIIWALVAVVLAMLPALIVWLAYRR
ncbi:MULTISPECIES: hypothetical protein [Okeania]|uniref:Uncharacterized protein n=1 Tax=Okeania hirsuta TaxID=1458930 RepID=A0A3N6PMT5_9CYAN|nr:MULTISPECIES: hypothetical protein [Okeania]NEP05585.1 hypothetical protein [Okeania sp. SIO4D6]NET12910.1 hypothetical protein [Okeania sp. SIO1H6]NEP72680.1 hypothetical protein [Okeania sp. SIO2G5]NEP93890.1 hypothetical protein [Okeania sp. SIO2F5]NEQ91327.1 hypothetical protein [Okeania sp. SIO2G4]